MGERWVRLGVKTNYILVDVFESCRRQTDAHSLARSRRERDVVVLASERAAF